MTITLAKPRVASMHTLPHSVAEYARQHFELVQPGEKNFDAWPEHAEAVMVRGGALPASFVDTFGPQLKFVSKHGVGVDRLDIKALCEKGVTVMNTPGVNAVSVAEVALALILGVARDIASIDRRLRNGEAITKDVAGKPTFTLRGKTLLLVGAGNISFLVGEMFYNACKGHIVIYDPYLSSAGLARWQESIPATHLRQVSRLEDGLPLADVMSIHVPLLDSTRNLIDHQQLWAMKRTAIIINTARGGIINEEALADALEQGVIAGAGIDAWITEPPTLETNARLLLHPRVISTPHIGAASSDVIEMTAMSVVDHLVEVFSGQSPRDVVRSN